MKLSILNILTFEIKCVSIHLETLIPPFTFLTCLLNDTYQQWNFQHSLPAQQLLPLDAKPA